MTESFGTQENNLSQEQQLILAGFLALHRREGDSSLTARTDQAAAELRERISGDFRLEIDSPDTYYALMTGIAVATDHMEKLIKMGLTPEEAGETTRICLAHIEPRN